MWSRRTATTCRFSWNKPVRIHWDFRDRGGSPADDIGGLARTSDVYFFIRFSKGEMRKTKFVQSVVGNAISRGQNRFRQTPGQNKKRQRPACLYLSTGKLWQKPDILFPNLDEEPVDLDMKLSGGICYTGLDILIECQFASRVVFLSILPIRGRLAAKHVSFIRLQGMWPQQFRQRR